MTSWASLIVARAAARYSGGPNTSQKQTSQRSAITHGYFPRKPEMITVDSQFVQKFPAIVERVWFGTTMWQDNVARCTDDAPVAKKTIMRMGSY